MLVVTTETIPGHQIAATLGEVTGVSVRSKNKYDEGLKALDGSSRGDVAVLMRRARHDPRMAMEAEAARLGANAIVAMRYDHREINGGLNEICCYGTAVTVCPLIPV